MGNFDFIADERLRDSLEKDFAEVTIARQGGAWKAVHVLVGSVIEALLVDYLLAVDYQTKAKNDPLKMDLDGLVKACAGEKALSEKAIQLAGAIRGYRNLIHPGRVLRLSEKADETGATVATALMQMIINEISERRKNQYGYTAEQIIGKIERDFSAMSILTHLLKEMSEKERERLTLKTIPDRYFELENERANIDIFGKHEFDSIDEVQAHLSTCFRTTFESLPESSKRKVAKHLVDIIKQEHQSVVLAYETAFFQATDLEFLSAGDRDLVKQHLMSRLKGTLTPPLVKACVGLGRYFGSHEIQDVVDLLIRVIIPGKSGPLKTAARERLTDLWRELPHEPVALDNLLINRLGDWIAHYVEKGQQQLADEVNEIKLELEVPF